MVQELIGTLKLIKETQIITDKFIKRELVLETEDQFPQSILLELHQDNCDIIDYYNVGQRVKLNISLRGREWVDPKSETRYFNTILCVGMQPFP